MNTDLLTPQEFADALRVSVETIRRRIRRNQDEGYFEPGSLIDVGTSGRHTWRIARRELDKRLLG
jgi:hypothetical protein